MKLTAYRNKKYLKWVSEQPCVLPGCQRPGPSDPHHIKGVGHMSGAGMKAPDTFVMPLCHTHHIAMGNKPEMWPDQWEYVARTLHRAVAEGFYK